MKSTGLGGVNTSGYMGYKPCASIEGATSEKIGDQIHKDSYPEMGCSGDLNLTDTVHSVNVGTSCFGCKRRKANGKVSCYETEVEILHGRR